MDAKVFDSEPDVIEMSKGLLRIMRGVNGQASRLFGTKIVRGPFAGMDIPLQTEWDDGNFGCKLMGTYEHELHDSLAHALWRKPSVVVNVGCESGYYAVGLARMLPEAKVFALDISDSARLVCEDYAELNKVKVTVLKGAKQPEELYLEEHILDGHRLYIMDVEGDEMELLDPKRCVALAHADIIVECHDNLRHGASTLLADRLAATHDVTLVRPKLPDFDQFPFLQQFPTTMSVLLVLEKRPMPTYWLTCWAKQKETKNG